MNWNLQTPHLVPYRYMMVCMKEGKSIQLAGLTSIIQIFLHLALQLLGLKQQRSAAVTSKDGQKWQQQSSTAALLESVTKQPVGTNNSRLWLCQGHKARHQSAKATAQDKKLPSVVFAKCAGHLPCCQHACCSAVVSNKQLACG